MADPAALRDQIVLVAGGGRGVGRAIAECLAHRQATVAVVSRSAAELAETIALVEEAGGSGLALAADLTDRRLTEEVIGRIEDEVGPIDLLVNNAGSCQAIGPIWEVDPNEWWRDIEVNLRATFLCSRVVLPGMLARGRGRVINVSSYVAARPSPYVSGYAAAKAAVLSFTEGLAAAVKSHGISVFAITPGRVRTAMTDYMAESDIGRRWLPELGSGEWLEPQLAGQLVVFLASGRGDRLSGRFIHALDDVEDMVRRADEIEREDLYTLRLRRDDA